jgi:hypothetical protein
MIVNNSELRAPLSEQPNSFSLIISLKSNAFFSQNINFSARSTLILNACSRLTLETQNIKLKMKHKIEVKRI